MISIHLNLLKFVVWPANDLSWYTLVVNVYSAVVGWSAA